MDVILDGKESLEDAFAEISQQKTIRKMQDAKKDETKIPRNVLLLIKQKETMQKLLCVKIGVQYKDVRGIKIKPGIIKDFFLF